MDSADIAVSGKLAQVNGTSYRVVLDARFTDSAGVAQGGLIAAKVTPSAVPDPLVLLPADTVLSDP